MSSSLELQREREVQGYLQSWQVAQGSSLKVAHNVANIVAPDLQGTSEFTPQPSPDKALTALAQLAVFRLNVKRAMVSLIDDSSQYVLAEATRNLRLGDLEAAANTTHADAAIDNYDKTDKSRNNHSDLWHSCTARDPGAPPYTAPGLVIPDCRLDPRFHTRTYVKSEPGIRFYAGVPIFSRRGHKIGTYSVSDERPRDGLSVDELQFMQSVAQAAMEHLEWARDRVDRFKGERLVRGLATFIEGCSSDDPTLFKEQPRMPPTVQPPELPLSANTRSQSRRSSSFRKTASEPAREPSAGTEAQNPSPPQAAPPKPQSGSDGLSRMFQRAAETLRNSTLADGVVVFGATAAIACQAARAAREGTYRSSGDGTVSPQVTSGSECPGIDSSDNETSPLARPCKTLAYSLAEDRASVGIEEGAALSLGMLDRYYSLFPKGKAFYFTEEGIGVSSGDDSASDREPAKTAGNPKDKHIRRRKAKINHSELLKKIPGVKSVVFLPLFDYVEDRLIGGCFLWTSASGQMMNLGEDLSYLQAFGNSIVSQIGRINTQKNEAAKTTFIASMSHELRSPLHGILGAAEFLKDTMTDSYQSGLITSISTCGRTLLDTLNHVLDYSKINRLGRIQKRRGVKQGKLINISSDSLESLSMTAAVNLAVLVEEVVDAVATGHTFKRLPGAYSSQADNINFGGSADSILGNKSKESSAQTSVSVLIDICQKTGWMVKTQPGALRRIIMNLFGNALKYTSAGYILVSLRGQESADGSKVDVVIRVVDTGKGMSEDFQDNHLFIPFSQEDSFQPGTGLGLSIVKQIVDSLGGTLEVKSQQHQGTEITVRLRFTQVAEETSSQFDETVRAAAEKTKGQCLVLLEGNEDLESPAVVQQVRTRNETLADTCSSWFGMKVAKEGEVDINDADIYIYSEPPSVESLERRFRNTTHAQMSSSGRNVPIVIICLNEEEAVRIAQTQTKTLAKLTNVVEVIPQ
ncbi:hypothetical protein FZEAL_10822, partial [Fusarium zealandicum]